MARRRTASRSASPKRATKNSGARSRRPHRRSLLRFTVADDSGSGSPDVAALIRATVAAVDPDHRHAGVRDGPGSAKQREERCIAPGTRDWRFEMDDQTVRVALQRHWDASDASDFEAEH